jgi:hypothetical protein
MTKPLSLRSGSRQLLAHILYIPYRTSAAESAGLCSTSDGTRTSRACRDSGPYTPDYRLKGLAASESFIDRHAAMTIVGRKWNRLTKVIRERVGTAGKTASSRDLHLDRVAQYTILQCCRRTTRGRLHAEPTVPEPIAHSPPYAPCMYNVFRTTPRRS